MKDYLFVFGSYMKRKSKDIIIFLVSAVIFGIVFYLYSLPLESVLYGGLLIGVFLIIVGLFDFLSFYKKFNMLREYKINTQINDLVFSGSNDLISKEYEKIIEKITRDKLLIINEKDHALSEMIDYYTI